MTSHNIAFSEDLDLVFEAIESVATEELPELTPESEIADLGYSSVQTLEFLTHIEEATGVRLPPRELVRVRTIADLAAVVRTHLTAELAR
ncbi:acyl carrier protein [Mycobacteroides abscessus]|uniref:acyl carrier protein n=1 Tax=Mycobacteroides abscessus TaxID=36809 RepID=UPI0005DDC482|nr:acyl carrier protein [Mycobacteroides abscessus]CPS11190.1 Acyl carrier protein [Mycobacteroides abscessus]CPS27416.1 Acyl carrier protein [Mycobacteroides abscessus]CPS29758.1 Acyl carrier protein [Mycobacteroides abscessus]CPT11032.1 Acyl carrier protein [Mycobacteroides abscessus]CPT30381.1 Acyl carrier protein [Mycobacteroides abscessus]